MDMPTPRASARIYLFPPGGRAAVKAVVKPAAFVVAIPAGRAWYHDVAIRDANAGKEPEPRG